MQNQQPEDFFYSVVKDAPLFTPRKPGKWKMFVNVMRVGDSVRVHTFQESESLRNAFYQANKKITVRKRNTSDGLTYYQVWRIV
tara:strand:+ start:517 stop:768 length:252 start_codon:yes stop_codon:yes gene_type:complete